MTADQLLVLAVIVSLNVFPSLQLTTLSHPVITLRPILAHHGEDDLLPCLCEAGGAGLGPTSRVREPESHKD